MRTIILAVALLAAVSGASGVSAQTDSHSAVLRFQVIEADGFTARDTAIRDVEAALRDLFRFKGYRLAAEGLVRVTSNTKFEQTVYGADDSTKFVIQGTTGDVLDYHGNGSVAMNVDLWSDQSTKALTTSVVVPFGQTVVLGSAKPQARRAALILVVRPTTGAPKIPAKGPVPHLLRPAR